MPYNLIDIAVVDSRPHPTLDHRTVGRVRAVLNEVQDDRAQDHELSITVWTATNPEMSGQDIEMALLLKAADIVGRVRTNLERGDEVQGSS